MKIRNLQIRQVIYSIVILAFLLTSFIYLFELLYSFALEELVQALNNNSHIKIDILVGILIVPLFEELIFRGAMFSTLLIDFDTFIVSIITSVIWASLHFTEYTIFGVAFFFIFGMILAKTRNSFDSVTPCILIHAIFNLSTSIYFTSKM